MEYVNMMINDEIGIYLDSNGQQKKSLELAVKIVLGGTIVVQDTPVLLNTANTRGIGLPRLVVGLKDKSVDTPGADGANSILPEVSSVLNRRLRNLKVLTRSRPAGLTNPELNVSRALDGLDGLKSLHDIVKERVRRVSLSLTLPVREGIGEENIRGLNNRGGTTINKNVPGISSSNGDRAKALAVLVLNVGHKVLNVGDLVGKLRGGHVLTVKSLRADSEGNNVVNRNTRKVSLKSLLLSSKVGIVVGPDTKESLKVGLLQSRTKVSQGVTVTGSVNTDNVSVRGHFLKVPLEVSNLLTLTVRVSLDTEVETKVAHGVDSGQHGNSASSGEKLHDANELYAN